MVVDIGTADEDKDPSGWGTSVLLDGKMPSKFGSFEMGVGE
jgi:hypothetical protein